MGEAARVDSIEALRAFKTALWKFQESATVALGDAEAEMHRVMVWLETEQDSYWQGQIRKRQQEVARGKEAVRMKRVFKDATGRPQSAIEEEKALQQMQRKLQEAEQKLAATKRWSRVMQKEVEMYKGGVQRFATTVQSGIPAGVAALESLATKLDAYIAAQMAAGYGGGTPAGSVAGPSDPSMSRGGAMAMPAGSPEEIAQLKEQAPSAQARAAAPLATEVRFQVAPLNDEQRTAVASVANDAPAPSEGKVFIETSAATAPRIFLHRAEPTSPDDTGWSVAPAAGGAEWSAAPVKYLLQARPDLADLLGLPTGFSAIIDDGGLATVTDPQQRIVWQRP